MTMAVTHGAVLVAVMIRRLLDERGVVGGVNAGERDGIRGARGRKSNRSESRRGKNRLHVSFSSKPQARVACRLVSECRMLRHAR